MPTISQLPASGTVSASDLLPVSQGGSAHAVSVGVLLAQTQPAIIVQPPSLLGRFSVGPGGPDEIAIGSGLMLNSGTLSAQNFDPTTLFAQTTLSSVDQFIVANSGTAQLIGINEVRGIFSAGSNITIDTTGVISTSAIADASNYSITGLSPVANLTSGDLIGVSQAGEDHSITYTNFLDGLTIDQTQAAGPASDTDEFLVAQASNIMLRQTLRTLWPWVSEKLPSWQRPVLELTTNTTLESAAHNNIFLVCSNPISVSISPENVEPGFSCEIINASSGSVIFSGDVVTSSGSAALLPNQCATILGVTYSGGAAIFISVSAGISATVVPGQPYNLAASSVSPGSVTLSWATPASGGEVSVYTIQYRVTGASSWLVAGQTSANVGFAVNALEAATSYDFAVIAANNIGAGPVSSTLTVVTSASGILPGSPTNVTITNVTTNSMNCSWTAPTVGGTGLVYLVQYSLSGQENWTLAANNLSATTYNIMNLTAATSYDVQVIASNNVGSGPPSSPVVTVTTQSGGTVTSITWQLVPTGTYAHGVGTIGINAHVNPAAAPIQFGFSTSQTTPPSTWMAAVLVNSDLWGQYVPTPVTPGSWYAWAEDTDGSSPTVYATPFTVT
jgi:hypothetical protein